MSFVLLLGLLSQAVNVVGQVKGLFLYGKIDDLVTATDINGLRVSVQEVGADTSTRIYSPITTGQWTYEFTLEEQRHYELRAEAPGKISKYAVIDTQGVPSKRWAEGYGINLNLSLLDSVPDYDLSMFNGPYAKASYNRSRDSFLFDMAYTKLMRKHTQDLLKKTGRTMAPKPKR